MELKRYVLVRNTEVYGKSIVDTVIDTHLHVYENDVIKTSDNILDLVEKDDIIEHHVYGKMFVECKYIGMYDEIYINDYNVHYGTVAIYKRQPNGDYKRYSVDV